MFPPATWKTARRDGGRQHDQVQEGHRRCRSKVAKAEAEAFTARLEAIEAILRNTSEYDVLMLCARVLATVVPDCCDKHQEEFKGEFLRVLSDCVEIVRQERDAAEADENRDSDAHPPVHWGKAHRALEHYEREVAMSDDRHGGRSGCSSVRALGGFGVVGLTEYDADALNELQDMIDEGAVLDRASDQIDDPLCAVLSKLVDEAHALANLLDSIAMAANDLACFRLNQTLMHLRRGQ